MILVYFVKNLNQGCRNPHQDNKTPPPSSALAAGQTSIHRWPSLQMPPSSSSSSSSSSKVRSLFFLAQKSMVSVETGRRRGRLGEGGRGWPEREKGGREGRGVIEAPKEEKKSRATVFVVVYKEFRRRKRGEFFLGCPSLPLSHGREPTTQLIVFCDLFFVKGPSSHSAVPKKSFCHSSARKPAHRLRLWEGDKKRVWNLTKSCTALLQPTAKKRTKLFLIKRERPFQSLRYWGESPSWYLFWALLPFSLIWRPIRMMEQGAESIGRSYPRSLAASETKRKLLTWLPAAFFFPRPFILRFSRSLSNCRQRGATTNILPPPTNSAVAPASNPYPISPPLPSFVSARKIRQFSTIVFDTPPPQLRRRRRRRPRDHSFSYLRPRRPPSPNPA